MSKINPKVDAFIGRAPAWQGEMAQLRQILLDCGLDEEIKWGKPCYAYAGGNIAILQPFKQHIALLFFKGMLLKDELGILVKAGENTVVGRQLKFTAVTQVVALEAAIKAYIQEAIEIEKAGIKIETVAKTLPVPEELQAVLTTMPDVEKAFYALTPGRQKQYIIHINGAKQAKTRQERIEKCIPLILTGKGLND